MDRIGLLARVNWGATSINQGRLWQNTEGREAEGRVRYQEGLSVAMGAFEEAGAAASEDLELVILAEMAFETQELFFCPPGDQRTINSLHNAIEGFERGLMAKKEVEAGASYAVVDRCLPYRKECRWEGLPKDAFHWACAGHHARLLSISRTPGVSETEKCLLEQRIANLETAQGVYCEMQRKALAGRGAAPPKTAPLAAGAGASG